MTRDDARNNLTRATVIAVAVLTVAAVAAAAVLGQSFVDGQTDPLSTQEPAASGQSRSVDTVVLAENGQLAAHVMLLSLEGARADYVEPYIVDGTMENLALLASNGLVTEYVQGVNPSSSVASHTSLASGSRPRVTGVVGERYRRKGQPTDRATEAVSGVSAGAPALWAWDDNADGSQDAVLFWPGVRAAAGSGDDIFVSFGNSLGPARTYALGLRAPQNQPAGLPACFSPLLMQHTRIDDHGGSLLAELWVVALDTLDDDAVAYDSLGLALAPAGSGAPAVFTVFKRDSWAILGLPEQPNASVAFKLTSIEQAGDESGVMNTVFYQSEIVCISSQPAVLTDELIDDIGLPAPAPEHTSVDAGLLSATDYLTLAEQHLRWETDAAIYIQEHYAPRILAVSFDAVRLISEVWLAGNDAGTYDRTLRGGYRTADQAVGRLLAGIDLNQSTVMIGSPNGYASAGIALNMRVLLDDIHSADADDALAVYSSGGSAHVVVNLAGREPGGMVSDGAYDDVVRDTVAGLQEFRLEGLPVFERVASGPELRDLGLDSPNSGDIFVQAAPDVVLYDHDPTGEGRLWWFTREAVAGYDANQPAMRGIFILAGRSAPSLGMVAPVHLTDLAPTLGEILNIEAPAPVEGRVLSELLR